MKNPNGYGTIKRLSGNRRRPFVFIITQEKKRKVVGCYETREAALIAQADFWRAHGFKRPSGITFSELYFRWLPVHIERHEVSKSSISGYKAAFNQCRALWDKPVEKIKYADLQSVLDGMKRAGLSYSSRKKCRSFISLIFKYARMNDIVKSDFSGLLFIGKNKPVRPHKCMTRQQINRLWACQEPGADTVLMLIYTGLRISELLRLEKKDVNIKKRYFSIVKSKTQSGLRSIPIHSLIFSFFVERMKTPGPCLIADESGAPLSYARYMSIWERVMKKTRGRYTPHDARHTFASLLDAADVNENSKKRLLGHAGGDVTNGVYTHKNMRQLRVTIEKIK